MNGDLHGLVEECIDRLARGDLQADHLREVLAQIPIDLDAKISSLELEEA